LENKSKGLCEGLKVGKKLFSTVGIDVILGIIVGLLVGITVGTTVGLLDGDLLDAVGNCDGFELFGLFVGDLDGTKLNAGVLVRVIEKGFLVGFFDKKRMGFLVGVFVGFILLCIVGFDDKVGKFVGLLVGITVGTKVGLLVGGLDIVIGVLVCVGKTVVGYIDFDGK